MTPLIAACKGGHSATAQLLIEEGADLDKQDYIRTECHVNEIMYYIMV